VVKILLTGGGGQVGRMLLESAPAAVHILAPLRAELDLTKPPTIAGWLAQAPDLVVNAGAFTAVDLAEKEPAAAFAANRDGAAELARQCAARDVPIVHLSTDYVFDGRKQGAYVESDAPQPISVYGQSKLEGEAGVREANPRHVILRCSWVFGPHGGNFVRSVLERAMRGEALCIVDDQRGCPTPTELIAAAVFAIAERYARSRALPWGLYHCAGREAVTRFAFGQAILDVARPWLPVPPRIEPVKTGHYATLARRPANSALDCALLAARLGVETGSWRAPLARTVADIAAALAAPVAYR
jgi:dTDP-4-dehydrorhamnose reductase